MGNRIKMTESNCKRKIKFRYFDNTQKKMFTREELKNDSKLLDALYVTDLIVDKHDIEIMQFTGLKDKNDKEIYEGDIIRISKVLDYDNFVTDVYFKDSAYRYRHNDGSGSVLPRYTKKVKGYEKVTEDFEIIGNIYENKELLE